MALTRQLINNNIYEGTYIKNIGNFGSVSIPLLSNAPIKFNYNVGNINDNSKIYVGFILGNMSKPILIPDKNYLDSIIKNSDNTITIDLSNYYTKDELQDIIEDSHTHENKEVLDNLDLTLYYKKSELQDVVNNSHNHENKEVLDEITDFNNFETLEALEFETLETSDMTLINIDQIVTEGSNNLITSGGVDKALKDLDLNQYATNDELAEIAVKIPSQASIRNQLADKEFVNSSINSISAFYITSDLEGNPFSSYSLLLTGPYYNKGALRDITQNDYALVINDENHDNKSVRYVYDGETWCFQYLINDTPFTAEQLSAINSGITQTLTEQIHTHENKEVLDTIKEIIIPKTLGIDTEVVNNSNNVVTSNAVYNYVVQKLSENDIINREVATIDDIDTSMFVLNN